MRHRQFNLAAIALAILGFNHLSRAQEPLYTLNGVTSGAAVSIGDVNNDGIGDVALRGHPPAGSRRSTVEIRSGSTGTLLHVLEGEADSDIFGQSIADAGDVNLDGIHDLVVGAPNSSVGSVFAGRVYVYSGSDWSLLYTLDGRADYDCFGNWVAGVGHLDADDAGDFIVGADCVDAGGFGVGRVYAFSGRSGNEIYSRTGEHEFDSFGYPVSGVGDFDGDGFDDFMVAATQNDAGGFNSGRVYLFSGRSGDLRLVVNGPAANAGNGISLSPAGDVNHDGFADALIGFPTRNSAYVFYGGPTTMVRFAVPDDADWILHGSDESFGTSVAGVHDFNNDGVDDVAVGAPYFRQAGSVVGRVYVFYGRRDGGPVNVAAQKADAVLTGPRPGSNFGSRLAGIGDVNDDLAFDILVTAPFIPFVGDIDRTYVFPGTFLQVIDPNPGFLTPDGTISADPELLAGGGNSRHGGAADGVTVVLLRAAVATAGAVTFSIDGVASPQDGELRTLDSAQSGRALTVSAGATDAGFRAFALYKLPATFDRGADNDLAERQLTLSATFAPATGPPINAKVVFSIVRPPVVFIHGLWSDASTWKFSLVRDARFTREVADYRGTNAASFADNLDVPRIAIKRVLDALRQQGIAATQADVVGHSMGGILTRLHIGAPGYKNRTNFRRGDVHRLLTLDTPHLGTPAATALGILRETPVIGAQVVDRLRRIEMPIDLGAIDDLAENSFALQSLTTTEVPSHGLVGIGGSDVLASTPGRLGTFYTVVNWLAPFFTTLQGFQHDGVVGRLSQQGGLPSEATSVFNAPDGIHIGFNTASALYSERLSGLLNEPPESVALAYFPAPPTAPMSNAFRVQRTPPPTSPVQSLLRIVEPVDGQIVVPGQVVNVVVQYGGASMIQEVLVVSSESTATDSEQPFEMSIPVPYEASGAFKIFAMGKTATGEVEFSDDVTMTVRPDSALTGLQVFNDYVVLRGANDRSQLVVTGNFADGIQRDLTPSSAGTVYTSSRNTIVDVGSDGLITSLGEGLAFVDVANGNQRARVAITVLSQGVPCDDADACTTDVVDESGECTHRPLDCDDQNPCTDDSCDSTKGCSNTATTVPCDDGDDCTTGDTCVNGSCVAGPPLDCDDTDACTVDSCNPLEGCQHVIGPGCNQPPDCSLAHPDRGELWPPNQRMTAVNIIGVADPDGDGVSIIVTRIAQDEPVNSDRPTTCPDGDGVGYPRALLRAARDARGDGRVYTISFTATDDNGAECSGQVKVCVPHDQHHRNCGDQGSNEDSTGPCGDPN